MPAGCAQSYPSGHAAYSHMTGAACCWYLSGRLGVLGAGLLPAGTAPPTAAEAAQRPGQFVRCVVALLPVALATFVATTRLTDGVHHFSDVNAGTFIGVVAGTLCYHLNFHAFWSGAAVCWHQPRARGAVAARTAAAAELLLEPVASATPLGGVATPHVMLDVRKEED